MGRKAKKGGREKEEPFAGGKAPEEGRRLHSRERAIADLLSPKEGLQISTPVPGLELFTIDGVLTERECETVWRAAESAGFEFTSSRGPAFGEADRSCGRIAFDDPELARALWERCGLCEAASPVLASPRPQRRGHSNKPSPPLGLHANIRFYRYSEGDLFGPHVDQSVRVGADARTLYTLLVYLGCDAGLQGGETVFYDVSGRKVVCSVTPRAGRALVHRHGDECLVHEGRPILSGVKYVLRSDIVFSS